MPPSKLEAFVRGPFRRNSEDEAGRRRLGLGVVHIATVTYHGF